MLLEHASRGAFSVLGKLAKNTVTGASKGIAKGLLGKETATELIADFVGEEAAKKALRTTVGGAIPETVTNIAGSTVRYATKGAAKGVSTTVVGAAKAAKVAKHAYGGTKNVLRTAKSTSEVVGNVLTKKSELGRTAGNLFTGREWRKSAMWGSSILATAAGIKVAMDSVDSRLEQGFVRQGVNTPNFLNQDMMVNKPVDYTLNATGDLVTSLHKARRR